MEQDDKEVIEIHHITEEDLQEYLKMSNENAIVVEELTLIPINNGNNRNQGNTDLIIELTDRMDKIEQTIDKHEQTAKQLNKTFSQRQAETEIDIQKNIVMKTIKTLVKNETAKDVIIQTI